MKLTVKSMLAVTFAATVALLCGLLLFVYFHETQAAERAAVHALYFDAFKVIVVSFFVGLLAILVPARLSEARDSFEKLKASRIEYSEAKTGLAYLPARLCSLKLTEAAALIQQVHFHKHQMQLYEEELKGHIKGMRYPALKRAVTAAEFCDEMYRRLAGYRSVLENHAHQWDTMSPKWRIELLHASRTEVSDSLPDGGVLD